MILLAGSLAAAWAFVVPIFQAPDEPAHFDYAISIYSRGLKHAGVGTAAFVVSPYTRYLLRANDFERIAWHSSMRAPTGYGARGYFARLDSKGPDPRLRMKGDRRRVSYVALSYPFAFYGIEALCMRLVSAVSGSLSVLFFSARLLCVAFLLVGLYFNYRTFALLGLSRWIRVAVLFAIGLLPLTTFVSSYVQPDNLAYALISAALFYATKWRKEQKDDLHGCWAMGTTLGLLSVTKYQFFAATALPIYALIGTRFWRARLPAHRAASAGVALILPAAALLVFQYTYVAPLGMASWGNIHSDFSLRLLGDIRQSPLSALAGALALAGQGFVNCFVSGLCAATYWQVVGWFDTPIAIVDWNVEVGVRILVTVISVASVMIVLARILRNLRITFRAAIGTHAGLAMTAISSDVVFNAYGIFLAMMLLLYVATRDAFGVEGRQLYPYAFAGLLVVTAYMPRSFGRACPRIQTVLAIMVAVYSALAAGFAFSDVKARYYGPSSAGFSATMPTGLSSPAGGMLGILRPVETGDYHVTTTTVPFSFERKPGLRLVASGAAAFVSTGAAASRVAVIVDDRLPSRVLTRQYDVVIGEGTRRKSYAYSGFYARLPVSNLPEGPHLVRAFAARPGSKEYKFLEPDRLFFLTEDKSRFSSTFRKRLAASRTVHGGASRVQLCFGAGWLGGGALKIAAGSVVVVRGSVAWLKGVDAVWLDVGGMPYPAELDPQRRGPSSRSSLAFFGTVPTVGLPPGYHSIAPFAMRSRESEYFAVARPLRFKVVDPLYHATPADRRLPGASALCHDPRRILAGTAP
ncbi:MAG TPA: DUF2142 domain-containing protein [Candidatus Tumulicola sp.]|nr:DUF2142 domain-containing protein [Candidatus Tumulicola sp.]